MDNNPPDAPPVLLLTSEVTARVRLARATIYAKIANGDFPEPIELAGNRSAWLADEIDAWIRSRPRARTAKSAQRRANRLAKSA